METGDENDFVVLFGSVLGGLMKMIRRLINILLLFKHFLDLLMNSPSTGKLLLLVKSGCMYLLGITGTDYDLLCNSYSSTTIFALRPRFPGVTARP